MVSETDPGTPPGRILVADDEPHIRRILSTLLRNAAFEVDEAVDGGEALALVDSEAAYDFILLDLMMPVADGLQVLKTIRDHDRRWATPVIILTAKGQDTDRQEAMEAGADDFLTKPFSPKKLLARIQEILAGH